MNKLCKLIPLLLVVLTACNKHSLEMKKGDSVSDRIRNSHKRSAPSASRVYDVPEYLDPKNDVTFKRIFNTDKEVTASFLNSILELKGGNIIEVESFENTENISSGRKPKVTYLDILVRDKKGNRYIIEMQLGYQAFFKKRVTYYAAHKYSEQLKKGGGYKRLNKVVCLTIAGHNLFRDDLEEFGEIIHDKAYRREYRILDTKTYKNDLEDLSWVFIEVTKFDKSIDNLEDTEERWCALLRGDVKTEENVQKVSGNNVSLKKAIDQLKKCNYTEAEIDKYRSSIIYIANLNVREKQKRDLFIKEGEEIGLKRGREEGIKEGEEKAKKEFNQKNQERKRKIIKKVVMEGLDEDRDTTIKKARLAIKNVFSDDSDTDINNTTNEVMEEFRREQPEE
ncbi:Rpn family recombination-promoting nuclease/putative transposase [Cardinium endosymbiont of Culicoides punctatus]|uniref:Rpn family recombination-promoting nuclease/putative transposase n=1 Tax=Cardinium endosymbiont of Culicoides punctatus TaxID=2304601 RepID=UPI001058CA55|nr:Rpn family recombination-promoting nuclease/putative transposase [Cardinium endosymbiont of Culicoides punctatus]TDG95605.1 hypothetical protein CCPUN_02240 [Cardinium endosymbiont of Culicoides punctatus]